MTDFKAIETFMWVVTLGSFRGAAQKLNTTQPAISQRIAQLEREVGVRLLQRDRRQPRLHHLQSDAAPQPHPSQKVRCTSYRSASSLQDEDPLVGCRQATRRPSRRGAENRASILFFCSHRRR